MFSFQGTASYLPEDYIRSRHLTFAVDTFSYGIFLFELVSGRPPSFQPPGLGLRMRDILLERDTPGEWVDKLISDDITPWPNCLFFLGKDCAQSQCRKRPSMARVLSALEKLHKMPSSLALQCYYDAKKNEVRCLLVKQQKILPFSINPKSLLW